MGDGGFERPLRVLPDPRADCAYNCGPKTVLWDAGRLWQELHAPCCYLWVFTIETWACFCRNFVSNKLFSIPFKAIMSAWISFWKPTAIPTRWTWTASELKNFCGDENYKNLKHQATVLIQPFRIDVFDFGNSYFLSK